MEYHGNATCIFFCGRCRVEKENKTVSMEKEDALNQARWRAGFGEIAVGVSEINPDQNWIDDDDTHLPKGLCIYGKYK